MKTLKDIISHYGYVDSQQLKELAKYFPDMQLVIKWGMNPREQVRAAEVADRIAHVETTSDDYVREVFLCSNKFRQLKEVLND